MAKPVILIVDDDVMNLTMAQMILEMKVQAEYLTADSGQACINVLNQRQGKVDLILLDIAMPGMDGIQTLTRIRQFTITVESDHPAWGSVTGGGTYYYGDTIQISATANLGFAFLGWDDGVESNPRAVIVTEDQTFIAKFDIRQCVISTSVSPEGSGFVNGGGTYNYGEIIHLVAHSNTGYIFDKWADGEIANPRNVFVENDASFTALFTPLQYEITTISDPEEGGRVYGGGMYDYGWTATLTATPNENYIFLCWSDGIVSNPRNVTVTGNATYKALFHQNGTPQYTVTVLSNDANLGIVSGSGTYPEGVTIEISATPISGAVFTGWDDGNTDNPRSVHVTGNLTFTAIFSMIPT